MAWTLLRIPLRLASPNAHRGTTKWAAIRHTQEVRAIREQVREAVAGAGLGERGRPVAIQFTRVAPRRLDSDNLVAAFKPARDGLCTALGFDDAALSIASPDPEPGSVLCTFRQATRGRTYWVELLLTYPDPPS